MFCALKPFAAWFAPLAAVAALVLLPSAVHADTDHFMDPSMPEFTASARLRGTLRSVGANTMDVITFGWIQLFRKSYPEVEVTMEARTSLSAIPALTNGLADLAPIGREMLPSEEAMFRQKHGYSPTLVRVAGGSFATNNRSHAIAVFVHKDNPINQLSLAQLDAIFSASRRRGHAEIATWGDLGLDGEWASRPITLYAMRRPNGIVNFFQTRVLLDGEFRPGINERDGRNDAARLEAVVASIADDPSGIGYAGFAQWSPGVKALALAEDASGPFVEGSLETIASHTYPLSRWIYIAINKAPGKSLPPNVHAFLALVLSREGQRVVAADEAFLPLPAAVVREELARLSESTADQGAGTSPNR